MNEDISRRAEAFYRKMIKNSNIDALRHEAIRRNNVSLEEAIERPGFSKKLSYRQKAFEKESTVVVIHLFGEEIEFTKLTLVKALDQLDAQSFQMVLLYYCMQWTDAEICTALKIKSRSTIQYRRKKAIGQLKELLKDFEEDDYELL